MDKVIRALFVAWRGPVDQSMYLPVARITEVSVGSQVEFEFCYIRGVERANAEGFTPFREFPDIARIYRSREMFPFLRNRLMNPSRPDYLAYVERLGLSPATVQPLELLGRSMGLKSTDNIELFPLPVRPASTGLYTTFFLLRGIRYRTDIEQRRIDKLRSGESLEVVPDPSNEHDCHAMRLFTQDKVFIGYVPTYLSEDICQLRSCCGQVQVCVDRVNPYPAPVQHRVVCRVETCWPNGFHPFSSDRYMPVSAKAGTIETAELAIV